MASSAILEALKTLLSRGPLSSSDIQAHLDISQANASRLLKQLGTSLVGIGKARSTQYALSKETAGEGHRIPIYLVNAQGKTAVVATLYSLVHGGYYLQVNDAAHTEWLYGISQDGIHAGLPYFLDNLRPQGFLGREMARTLSQSGLYPADPRMWNDTHVLKYLMLDVTDNAGNILVGQRSLDRYLRHTPVPIKNKRGSYPDQAIRVLAGEQPGFSVAGEQPKFLAYTNKGHVIVKYSPAGQSNEVQRWRDLLISEHIALKTLRSKLKIETINTTLHDYKGRIFLECIRYDRHGLNGRSSAIAIDSIDAEYIGVGQYWPSVAQGLHKLKRLNEKDRQTIITAHLFGQWIANNDMHLGNLSVSADDDGFKLLPIYDMLPMKYAPMRGELADITWSSPQLNENNQAIWHKTGLAGCAYWKILSDEKSLSKSFLDIAKTNAEQCHRSLKK